MIAALVDDVVPQNAQLRLCTHGVRQPCDSAAHEPVNTAFEVAYWNVDAEIIQIANRLRLRLLGSTRADEDRLPVAAERQIGPDVPAASTTDLVAHPPREAVRLGFPKQPPPVDGKPLSQMKSGQPSGFADRSCESVVQLRRAVAVYEECKFSKCRALLITAVFAREPFVVDSKCRAQDRVIADRRHFDLVAQDAPGRWSYGIQPRSGPGGRDRS